MYDLAKTTAPNGVIEKYGASRKLTDEVTNDYSKRGTLAARLLVATLTETPYKPCIGKVQYGIEVSNVYTGHGAGEGQGADTVDEAREALAEFLAADVPGVPKVSLATYKTRYATLWDELAPARRTPAYLKDAFDESFVESARASGVPIARPKEGLQIISRAPRTLQAMRLSDRDRSYLSRDDQILDAVTEAGYIVKIHSYKKYGGGIMYYLGCNVSDIKNGNREGRAPGSTITSDISRRVIRLRTESSKR